MLETTETTLPLKAGFMARPATMSDMEAAVTLLNRCAITMTGAPDTNLDELETGWTLPDFDLSASTRLVFNHGGRLVGMMVVHDLMNPVRPWVWGRVDPDFEGMGIGTYLMKWGKQRARQAIARAPEDARVVMRSGTVSTYQPAKDLFESLGMTLIRHFWRMVIELDTDLPEPQWPAGVTLRTFADLPDLRPVYRAVDEAFQDHWGHVDRPEEQGLRLWQQWLDNNKHFDPSLWFLAMDGDDIAAMSLCKSETPEDPQMGYVDTLGVRRPWRRRRLALALLHHSFRELYRRGKARAGLDVDASSLTGATRLYEKAGMHVDRQYDTYELELRPGRDLTRQTLDE